MQHIYTIIAIVLLYRSAPASLVVTERGSDEWLRHLHVVSNDHHRRSQWPATTPELLDIPSRPRVNFLLQQHSFAVSARCNLLLHVHLRRRSGCVRRRRRQHGAACGLAEATAAARAAREAASRADEDRQENDEKDEEEEPADNAADNCRDVRNLVRPQRGAVQRIRVALAIIRHRNLSRCTSAAGIVVRIAAEVRGVWR